MNPKDKLAELKNKIISLQGELEVIADGYQEHLTRLDQNTKSVFETNLETDLKEKHGKLREAIKKLAETEELIFDVIY